MNSIKVPFKEYTADYPISKQCLFLFCQVCVIYHIFHYLAHLSPCHHLGVALQSVIYVYW